MRKRVVDHAAIKLRGKAGLLYVRREQRNARISKLGLRAGNHRRRKINPRYARNVSRQIIRNQNTRSAGNVQHGNPRANIGVVENSIHSRLVSHLVCVPGWGKLIKEFNYTGFFQNLVCSLSCGKCSLCFVPRASFYRKMAQLSTRRPRPCPRPASKPRFLNFLLTNGGVSSILLKMSQTGTEVKLV